MNDLPPIPRTRRNSAFEMLLLDPMTRVAKSLRYGDGWEPDELAVFAQRCRAVADAFDARLKLEQQRKEAEK